MIKGVIYAPCSAFVLAIVVGFFTDYRPVMYGVAALGFFVMLYIALIGSNIRFELSSGGRLRYFKGGSERRSFDITKCSVWYNRHSDMSLLGGHSLLLRILPDGAGEEVKIDCDALGLDEFMAMFKALDAISLNETEVLSATK
jgi:hypothetical protein